METDLLNFPKPTYSCSPKSIKAAIEQYLVMRPSLTSPFILSASPIIVEHAESVKEIKEGEEIQFNSPWIYRCVPLSEFPADTEFEIVISGHMVDER